MRWRDIFIGALITLLVTIIGGVIVYYMTREPSPKRISEKLVYQADTQAKFASEKTQLSFHQVRLGNIGDEAARNVLVGVEYLKGTSIVDSSVAFSSGPAAGSYSVKKDAPSKLIVTIATVTPDEQVTIALIVDGGTSLPPQIAIKSDKTVGINAPIVRELAAARDKKAELNKVMNVLVPLALLLQIPLVIRLRRSLGGGIRSINNVAFMYVHKGLNSEAKAILQADIVKRGATSYELANYGLCLGLDGDFDKAEKHFQAAEFYSAGKKIKGLVSLYRSILAYRRGVGDESRKHLKDAMKASPRQIKRYATFSDLIEEMRVKDPESKRIVDNG